MAVKKSPEPTGRYAGTSRYRVAREEAGVSRQAIADHLGWTLARAWAIENAKREPTADEVKAWNDAIKWVKRLTAEAKAASAKPVKSTVKKPPAEVSRQTAKRTAARKEAVA
jgi:transcriptional regulator with XRE-family HTH domain